jgi:hypothetical protein
LQSILKTDLTGGLTALEIQGLSHYLSLSENKIVYLFGNDLIPEWVSDLELNVKFADILVIALFPKKNNHHRPSFYVKRDWDNGNRQLIISSPERRILKYYWKVLKKQL